MVSTINISLVLINKKTEVSFIKAVVKKITEEGGTV